jgi:iron complex outermembrane receptor protein
MNNRSSITAALAGAALTCSCVAAAETVLEDIVVTAQKREQSLQDVGISVTALSGEQLDAPWISRSADVIQQVPALQFSAWTPAFTIFNLRGISQNSFQDHLEAPVAVYMDGAYVASMNAINPQLFDLERVEVLRGPQGTLFGRNATGGLLQVLSRRPVDEKTNGYLEAGFASFDTYSVEGAAGGAFSDRVRGRISGRWEQSDGYLKAGTAFDTPATGQTSQGADGYALRGALQIDAGEATLIDLTASYSEDDRVPTGQYVVTLAGFDPGTGLGAFTDAYLGDPGDPIGPQDFPRDPITGDVHRHWSNEDPYYDRESTSLTAQVKAPIGALELVSVTNWMSLDKFYVEDAAGGLGFFPYTTIADYEQWSQELRLSGGGARARWQAGLYYLDMTWDTSQRIEGALYLGGTSDTQSLSTFGLIDSTNWSVFGQVEFDLADRWTLIAGLRWSQDDKDLEMWRIYEDLPGGIDPVEVFNINDVAISGINTIDYGDYAARAQINFRPTDEQLVYVAWNRGIKGGNWSIDPGGGVADEDLQHDEEVLQAFELGWKSEFWNGAARLNAAAFYYDYKDYQAFSLVNLVPQITNSDADASGGEIELTMTPIDSLYLAFGASFIDSTVDAVPTVFGGTVEAEFPNAPGTSLNMLARYEWPAFGGSFGVQFDGKWSDDQYLEGTNSEVSFESAYSVWNAMLSYTSGDERFAATLYSQNLFDEEYRLYNLDLGLLGFIEQAYGPPQKVGVAVRFSF